MLTAQIVEVFERAKARMLMAPQGACQAEIIYMTPDELRVFAEWRNSLPSLGEERQAAKQRLLEKRRNRK